MRRIAVPSSKRCSRTMGRLFHRSRRRCPRASNPSPLNTSALMSLIIRDATKIANSMTSKCDEAHPVCGACERHDVPCEYAENYINLNAASTRAHNSRTIEEPVQRRPLSDTQRIVVEKDGNALDNSIDARMSTRPAISPLSRVDGRSRLFELRLMHQFTAYTSLSFSTAGPELWNKIAPRVALSYPFLLNAIFALGALHLSRLDPSDVEALQASRVYYEQALDGESQALSNVNDQGTAEALFLTSTLITFHSLVLIGSEDEANDNQGQEDGDPFRWLKLGSGGRIVYEACMPFLTHSEVVSTVFRSEPNLSDNEVVYAEANQGELAALLEWGTDFEAISEADEDAYGKTVSFVGLIFQKAREGVEPPLASCRRVTSMPARCPRRFVELVGERRPRALAILAHLFAALKLIRLEAWWMAGIAERQVGMIHDMLPKAWRQMIALPLQLVSSPQPTSSSSAL